MGKFWAHHEKPRFFETKTVMLGKIEGSKKRGKPNLRGIDSIKEAIDAILQELSRAAEDRTSWTSLIVPPGVGTDSAACNTHLYNSGFNIQAKTLGIILCQPDDALLDCSYKLGGNDGVE